MPKFRKPRKFNVRRFAVIITLRNGRKLDARDYGYKCWPIAVR